MRGPGLLPVRGQAHGLSDGFVWARADHRELQWFGADGQLQRIVRWDEEPVPVTNEWRAQYSSNREEVRRGIGMDNATIAARAKADAEWFERHQGPVPYWDQTLLDDEGNVWLREYANGRMPSSRWRVISRDGSVKGWVDIPDVIAVLDVADDQVLAVRFDDFDVPAVVMMTLNTP